ncbi:MAG: hypothetical protein ACXWP1_12635 [Bdellovibrionota bacterium]
MLVKIGKFLAYFILSIVCVSVLSWAFHMETNRKIEFNKVIRGVR